MVRQSTTTNMIKQDQDIQLFLHIFFVKLYLFYEVFDKQAIAITSRHIWGILPKDFRHRRPSVWRDSNPRSRGWGSSTLTTRPSAPPQNVSRISNHMSKTAFQISIPLWDTYTLQHFKSFSEFSLRTLTCGMTPYRRKTWK